MLLGDPGAGKSHLFRAFSGTEGGRYVTVRTFLATPVRTKGETLFIDGLDEKRAGRGDRDTLDALVGKLFEAAPAKVRLSCRAADWLGESDLVSLGPFFEQSGGKPTVLGLTTLSKEEGLAVLMAHGLTAAEAEAFPREAQERGLGELLENPQNLLMLIRVVRSGQWPKTRKALFELSTDLMLEESDSNHAVKELGKYSAKELRPVAGAILAARLISDIEGIGLTEQAGSAALPGYRSLDLLDRELVQAALTRRVFVAGASPQSVDYAHRTTAEYLGAAWLASAVRGGLPLLRLQALLGVDGHPAPELRGLHAWLAVHLPEHAPRLIDADPYGVLIYGDASSLSPSNCARLVEALGHLSQKDPWFRRDAWGEPPVGALSRADMIEAFRKVMHSEQAGFGVRSIVVEALALGVPQPDLTDDLAMIVVRSKSSYVERRFAVKALLKLGTIGKNVLADLYRSGLGKQVDELRLRVDILRAMYGDPFRPQDVFALIRDIWSSPNELPGGVLWFLADALPLIDIPAILDGIERRQRTTKIARRNAWEIARFYERILMRAWNELAEIEPGRALQWLHVNRVFRDNYSGGRDEFRSAIGAKPDRLLAIADYFLSECRTDDERWRDLYHFQEATLHLLASDEMLGLLISHFMKAPAGSARRVFLYEMSFSFIWRSESQLGRDVFEKVYDFGEGDTWLLSIRDTSVCTKLPDRYLEHKIQRDAREAKEERGRAENRTKFKEEIAAIRAGSHTGWLGFLAGIYYGLFAGADAQATPQERLAFFIGEENVPAAMEGLKAALSRRDRPGLQAVVDMATIGRVQIWWRAVLVAMDERFAADSGLSAFPDDLLSAAIVLDLVDPIPETQDGKQRWRVPAWKNAALDQRPDLVHTAYKAIARVRFAESEQHVDGLRALLTEEAFKPYRAETILEFLRDFPNANRFRLNELLDAMLAVPEAHRGFVDLAVPVIDHKVLVDQPQYDQWLAAAYIVSPSQFEAAVETTARGRRGLVFDLRDFASGRHGNGRQTITLTLPQLEFIARLIGALHPYTPPPAVGWSGDTNAWDASDYFNALINQISANPSETAAQSLARLEALPVLASYRSFLLNAKARQQARRREVEYDRPDWSHTLNALTKGPPATVGDLHAMVLGHLDDVRFWITRDNTDGYKLFWNLDSYGRHETPLPEDVCRDRLIDRLRIGLVPLSVMVEPEGHMARDKRADISVAMPERKILCELKRDYHRDVWKAADEQLERFYVHDPAAHGFGVYVVLWFGDKRPRDIPSHPGGQPRPGTPEEMERMLRELLPADRKERIAIVVVDVSGAG
ncbi:hypothetical protein [Pseudorhodoplanes sp.]|uniref:hypothetical protein n=1 Tax=Pseudorhodoplanes sp. TaxID=1934341 RepID=UPI002CFF7F02|nr:hypothetical protein [Pseudorhodoplanes sp.]HWV54722.1 hypothetical protein [Pseudorhodoplanes sp.]